MSEAHGIGVLVKEGRIDHHYSSSVSISSIVTLFQVLSALLGCSLAAFHLEHVCVFITLWLNGGYKPYHYYEVNTIFGPFCLQCLGLLGSVSLLLWKNWAKLRSGRVETRG